MKPSSTFSSPRAPSAAGLVSVGVACAVALACVSSSKHGEVVAERDALKKRAELLERTKESLDAERVQLISELEETRQAKEKLDADVAELAERKEQLEIDLAKSEKHLAERTQEVDSLRSTYDGLVNDLQSEVAAGRVQIEQLRDGLHVKLAQEILFASGSADLSREGEGVLGKVAARLKEVGHKIEVQGHTDNHGTAAYNKKLSEQRSASVKQYLVAHGITPDRLTSHGYGFDRPLVPNDSDQNRALNRRVQFVRTEGVKEGCPPSSK